jgi:hypothetical protein
MATKKAKTLVENEADRLAHAEEIASGESRADAVIAKYGNNPIHGADNAAVNKALEKLTLVKPELSKEVIDGYESELHFIGGIVPAGFSNTYGQEITNAEDGQAAELVKAAHKVFKQEDGFRFFLKFLDNFIFTVIVPIKFSNQDDLAYAYFKGDFRSLVLKPGNTNEQVENYAKKVARNLGYIKNR